MDKVWEDKAVTDLPEDLESMSKKGFGHYAAGWFRIIDRRMPEDNAWRQNRAMCWKKP